MLVTDSIDPSVKNFSFLTDSIDHRFEKKNYFFDRIKQSAQDFFSSKDHQSNRCFLQLIDYRYRSNQCFFFSPLVPPMDVSHYKKGKRGETGEAAVDQRASTHEVFHR